jgi:hypothetical protein
MSMFICAECDGMADADDGCEEAANGRDLICVECAQALWAEENEEAE